MSLADKAIKNRYEFVYLFDVENGNPNGDPDAGNMPRIDPETNVGIVTDVCLKRKIRNYIQMLNKDKYEIFIRAKEPMNPLIEESCKANNLPSYKKGDGKWDTDNAKKRSRNDIALLQKWLCEKYYDIRTFGAVMSTGPNAGQIQGPVQMAFAKSIDPIFQHELTITRVTDVDKEEGEMGRKHIVPYGLYRADGYISANFAKRTGFSEDDLKLFWEALKNMFDHDHSAARGKMAARKLIVFKHSSEVGSAPAHKLLEAVRVGRKDGAQTPARSYCDYTVTPIAEIKSVIPSGVEAIEMI